MFRPTIAIVNDEATFRYLLTRFLNERGHDVLAESNEDSAMGTLVCRQPAAVVIEVAAKSRFSVLRLVERIRANSATTFMPVIVCSSDDAFHARYATELTALGCSVIGKPFDGDLLMEAIGRMVPRTTLSHSHALTA